MENLMTAAKQREALQFLADEIWGPDVFQPQAALMQKLQFTRFWDFEFSNFTAPRLDYPLHNAALVVQAEIFNDFYHPIKLQRIQDMELMVEDPADYFGLVDLFVGIREVVWSEVASASNINSFRRNLQREHLGHLIRLTLQPPGGTPEDGRSLARADLTELQGQIKKALGGQLDHITKAHLQETLSRIDKALDADMIRLG